MTDERDAEEVSVDSAQSAAQAEAGRGFGARLAAARERFGLTQAEVARALNLRATVIVAIEEEDFAELPQMAFVRGYARTYARLLEVPEDDIAEALKAWRDPNEDGRLPLSPASVTPKRSLGRSLHGHAGLILTLLSILVAVLLAAVLLMIWPEGGFTAPRSEPAVDFPAPAAEMRQAPAALPQVAAPEAGVEPGSSRQEEVFADDGFDGSEAAEEEAAQLLEQGTAVASAASLPVAADEEETAEAAVVAVRRESADDGRILRVFAGGEDLVELSFSGDCWVEIRDAEGRGVVSDLARAGQTFEVQGQGPFRVLLGYAHGVQITYNGEQVALAPHIRNDIASLVVGR